MTEQTTPDRVIINAAWKIIHGAHRAQAPKPVVWVIDYPQRDRLRMYADPTKGPYRPGMDVDTLFGIPILTVPETWSCPSNLTDLRGIE